MRGLSRKLYLDLSVPTEEDQRSDQQRILEALSAEGVKEEVHIPVRMLRQLYPLLDRAGWKITVSLSWNGEKWELVDIESGDTARQHYGLAVDLGSTTVVVRLLDCNSGEILGEESCFNKQIQWGTDILSRIFFCKDDRKKLEEIRLATVESIIECIEATKKLIAQRKELEKRKKAEESKKRTHRLCQIGGAVESVLGCPIEEEDLPKLISFLKRQETNGKFFSKAMQKELVTDMEEV